MATVAIIGILSALGISSLKDALANSKVRGEADALTGFFESATANTRRLADTLCITYSGTRIFEQYYVGEKCAGDKLDSFDLESGFAVVAAGVASLNSLEGASGTLTNWGGSGTAAVFYPKIGLNNVDGEGYLAVRYIHGDRYAAVVKVRHRNAFSSRFSRDGGSSWEEW